MMLVSSMLNGVLLRPYARVNLADHTIDGEPGYLPDALLRFSDAQLADLTHVTERPEQAPDHGGGPYTVHLPPLAPDEEVLASLETEEEIADYLASLQRSDVFESIDDVDADTIAEMDEAELARYQAAKAERDAWLAARAAEQAPFDAIEQEYVGIGYWPLLIVDASFDPDIETLDGDASVLTVDVEGSVVTCARPKRAKTLEEMAPLRERCAEAVNAKRDAVMYGGYAHDFGGEIGVQTLQTRQSDETSWLTLKDSCDEAVAAGLGDTLMPIPIRTADNVDLAVTFSQAIAAMRGMRAMQSARLAHSWSLKNAIAAADDPTSVDIEAGWPG